MINRKNREKLMLERGPILRWRITFYVMIHSRRGQVQKLTWYGGDPKFRRIVACVYTFLKCPKVGGLGPPEVSRIMCTWFWLKIYSYCIMSIESFDTFHMLLDIEIRKVIDPVIHTWIFVVMTHPFGMKI